MDAITRKRTIRILLVLVGVSSASPLRGTSICLGQVTRAMNNTLTGNCTMNEYEQLISDATHLVSSVAYKEAINDGHNEEVAKYVAAQVHHAFEIGWSSAIANSISLLKQLDID